MAWYIYTPEEIFKTDRIGAMSRDGAYIVHNDAESQQLLALDIRRDLVLYIKYILTKVDEDYFWYQFDTSVQQKMRFLTENIHNDRFNVMDFLGTMGYGYLFHGTGTGSFNYQVLRHLTMPAALLEKFAQGNEIGREFMQEIYWESVNTLLLHGQDRDDRGCRLRLRP